MLWDLVIVGGGPAGLSTALFVSALAPRIGLRTLVLEKATYPREKICAGAIGDRAEKLPPRGGRRPRRAFVSDPRVRRDHGTRHADDPWRRGGGARGQASRLRCGPRRPGARARCDPVGRRRGERRAHGVECGRDRRGRRDRAHACAGRGRRRGELRAPRAGVVARQARRAGVRGRHRTRPDRRRRRRAPFRSPRRLGARLRLGLSHAARRRSARVSRHLRSPLGRRGSRGRHRCVGASRVPPGSTLATRPDEAVRRARHRMARADVAASGAPGGRGGGHRSGAGRGHRAGRLLWQIGGRLSRDAARQ